MDHLWSHHHDPVPAARLRGYRVGKDADDDQAWVQRIYQNHQRLHTLVPEKEKSRLALFLKDAGEKDAIGAFDLAYINRFDFLQVEFLYDAFKRTVTLVLY